MDWVPLATHCRSVGETQGAVHRWILNGTWARDVHYRIDPAGGVEVSTAAYNEWIEGVLSAQGEAAPRSEQVSVYRCLDAAGRLLYVGMSLSALARFGAHRHSAGWVTQVARIDITWLSSREEAARAERKAIATERPIFNILGAKP